jgi:hypothetical protein
MIIAAVTTDDVLAYSRTQNDCSRSPNAIFATNCLLAANQGNYVCGSFLNKNLEESFSLFRRKNYHDLLCSLFVANFENVSQTYE